ncbi:MAG: hypothetical protein VYE22_12110 [Myxococcota bacterium]|nr:hypothetical protein [Myxococcota bacterium]
MAPRWLLRPILLFPERVREALARVEAASMVPVTPNEWQIALGVLRMWHRVLFRSETIGNSATDPVRSTWRARLLVHRGLRFPFLVRERAVAPLDFSGLVSSRERVIRHLLGAHHDGPQFAYDLALLSLHPGALAEARDRAAAVVSGGDPRAGWLRDLVVFEGYHERLLASLEDALARGVRLPASVEADPDISFTGYLRWCAAQPPTPEATLDAWRRGEWSVADGVRAAPTLDLAATR